MSDQCSWVLSLGRSRAHLHLCPSLVFCSLKISSTKQKGGTLSCHHVCCCLGDNFPLMNTEEKFCHFDASQWASTG